MQVKALLSILLLLILTACSTHHKKELTHREAFELEVKKFGAMPEEKQIEQVREQWWRLAFIREQTPKVQMAALDGSNNAICEVKNPNSDVQLYTIKRVMADGTYNMELSKVIRDFDERAQIEAVRRNAQIMQFIPYPSPALQLEAVKQNPYLATHIHNLTPEARAEAIKRNPRVEKFLK